MKCTEFYPNLLILRNFASSMIFIFRPSTMMIFSLEKQDKVLIALEVVILDKFAKSSLAM